MRTSRPNVTRRQPLRRRTPRGTTPLGHRFFHLASMLLLLAGLLAPMATIRPAAAAAQQEDGAPPPVPAPYAVVVIGDFQTTLGCGEDDVECGATNLQQNADGTWTGLFQIPAGSYSYQIVARSEIDRTLGEDGELDGDAISFDAQDGGLGHFFFFNQLTGEIYDVPVLNSVELATDIGQLPAVPTADGGFTVAIDASSGQSLNAQVVLDGNLVAEPFTIDTGDAGRVVVTIDADGSLDSESVEPSTLVVSKTDDAGTPLTGSCFSVYDGDEVVGQACDVDDGEDGTTVLRFPNGAQGNGLQLAESLTPEGQETADSQDIDIDAGDNSVQVTAGGGDASDDGEETPVDEDETPVEDDETPVEDDETPVDEDETPIDEQDEDTVAVEFILIDAAGNQISGGCLEIEGVEELCDDDGDGVIRFELAPNQTYTITETDAPDGFESFGTTTFDVGDADIQLQVPHTPGAGDEPTDEPVDEPVDEPSDDPGTLVITKTDDQGNALPGSCFTAGQPDGDEGGDETPSEEPEVCDEDDGSDDGQIALSLAPGDYTVSESNTPDGFSAADDLDVTIESGETVEETVVNEPSDGGFGSLIAITVDGDDDPLGGVCYNVTGFDDIVCDEDGDGDMGLIDTVPAGEVEVSQATVPDGFDLDPDTETVEVEAGEQVEVNFTSPATGSGDDETPTEEADDETPTEEPDEGDGEGALDVAVTDADGFAVVGVCIQYEGPDSGEVCDNGDGDANPDEGFIRIEGLAAGDYDLTASQLPEGFEPAEPGTVTIVDGEDATANLISGAAVEEETPTDTPEPEEPTATPEPENGTVLIRKLDADRESLAGSCFQLVAEDGTTTDLCDGDEADDDDRDGRIQFLDVAPGAYQLIETQAPDGYLAAEPQEIVVTSGEETRINFTNVLATGTLEITTTDGSSPIGGSCYDLSNAGQFCDDDGDGIVQITEIQPGDYTVTQASVAEGYALSDPASQDVTIVAGETATLSFTVALAQGAIEITTTDEGGTPLAEACYSVDGADQICDDDDDGVILIEGVATGDRAVSQTAAPEGYLGADDQTVTVVSGETAQVTFVSALATGSIRVTAVDGDGNGLTDFCASVDGADQVCDDGSGEIVFSEIAPGDRTVSQTQAPSGYDAADDQTTTVTAGETAEVVFTNSLAVGSLSVTVTDTDSGEPLAGATINVTDADGTTTEIADNGDEDANGDDGEIQADNLTPGDYTVTVAEVPEGFTVPEIAESATVDANETATAELEVAPVPPTETPTEVPTETPTEVPTDTPEPPTETPTEVPTDTPEPPTETPVPPTDTPTEEPTDTPEPPTETATEVPPTETATEEPEPTETEVPPTETATEEPEPTETATEVPIEEPTETATEEPAPEEPTETATEEPAPDETEIPIVIPPTEEPIEEPELGDLRITVVDTDGNPVVGACFALSGTSDVGPVCDGDDGDADDEEGTILIAAIPVGDYSVTQTSAPEGVSAAVDQTVTITVDDTAELTFTNTTDAPVTGQVRVVSVDAEGNPAGGGCYAVGSTEVCDNGDGDSDNAPGIVLITGVIVGGYDVTETTAPEGQAGAGPQPVEVVVDEIVEVTFTHEAAEAETGGVSLELTDADGNPTEGGCVLLSSETNGVDGEQLCDNGDQDSDPDPGVLEIPELAVGSYSVTQAPLEGEGDGNVQTLGAAGALDQRTFTVQANVVIVVVIVIIIIIDLPDVGDLQILKRALDTNALQTGVCFQVTGEGNDVEVCDNDDLDENGAVGIIRLSDLGSGSYDIEETAWPGGYEPAAARTVTVPSGGTRTVVFKNPPVEDSTGSLTVLKVDTEGDALEGACFRLVEGGTTVATVCDDDDGDDDGRILFADIASGSGYTLRETQAPSTDYQLAADVSVTIIGGDDDQSIEVVNVLKPGALRIRKTAEDGTTLLPGACFELQREDAPAYDACDNQTGDSSNTAGIIRFGNVPAGEWVLVEVLAPEGYDPAADSTVTIEPGRTLQVTVENTVSPPPAETGTLVVRKLVDGELAGGACFSLRRGQVTKYAACDGTNNDGLIEFNDIGTGDYRLHETKAPNPSNNFVVAADSDVSIEADETTTVEVTNTRKPGRILVIKRNTQGHPLQNGCFRVIPDPNDDGIKCSDVNGQVSFSSLPVGTSYKVRETKAPNGYARSADKTGIVVKPGLTTTVVVVDKRTPAPPTDGSILVIKFFCPAGKGGPTTAVLDSSNSGASQLIQTVGCAKGNASFTLEPSEGDGITFNTGGDGQYQTTVGQGQWRLSETSPGQQSEDVRIYAGQLTTVVVIDYVQPAAPKPGTVNVTKYTCGAGFEGAYYADFLANCAEETQLTNNVSFRLAGPSAGSRVTGNGGAKGEASFTQLKAGVYTLTEQAPSAAVTVYAFCGVNLDDPDYSGSGTVRIEVAQGGVVDCLFFNVPDEVNDSTGALVVTKYVCDAASYPSNYNYFENCAKETGGSKFAISYRQSSKFVPKTTGVTNASGILSFGRLQPGTYQLKEVGADWCFAKSDSVDAQGNIIVKAGERSNVFIFNCVPPKSPPNTGAGTTQTQAQMQATQATAMVAPAAAASAAGLLNLVVPVLGLAGLGLRRRLRGRRAA